ncbi:MAG: zinc-dependent alcohol dehydrogenase [Fimbriimonas sp.]
MCTEYKGYLQGGETECLGHEAVGTVVETDGVRSVKTGDRVVVMPQYPCGRCQLCLQGDYIFCEHLVDALRETGNSTGTATYAQLMIKPDWLLVKLPDDISMDHGAMLNCGFGPGFGAARKLGLTSEVTVLITGLGPVGLGTTVVAKWFGARVIAVESSPYRVRLARELGADEVLDPADPDILRSIRDLTGGRGVDKVIECSGAATAQRLAIDALRRLGRMAFIGEAGDLVVKVSQDFIRKGINLQGSWHYNLADTQPLLRVIREIGPQIDRLVSHRFPMSHVEEAWQLQASGECGKVLMYPWQ